MAHTINETPQQKARRQLKMKKMVVQLIMQKNLTIETIEVNNDIRQIPGDGFVANYELSGESTITLRTYTKPKRGYKKK